MPTPTSIPDTQLLQAVARTVDSAFQQGVVGVLLLFAATGFFVSIAIVVIAWSRRNTKPSDPTSGTNAAINALAEAISAGNKRFDDVLDNQKEKENADRQQDKEQNERYIESITAQSDATNNLADTLKKYAFDNISMKDDLHTMTTQGSKPLNELIQKFDEIKDIVVSIKENSDNDHKSYEKLLADVADMKAIVIRIEQKRTGEMNKVELNVTNPLPVDVVNQ